jgi:hypothetical protein
MPSEAIRGHQRSSEVIRGHQRSSEAPRGTQMILEEIRDAIRDAGATGGSFAHAGATEE